MHAIRDVFYRDHVTAYLTDYWSIKLLSQFRQGGGGLMSTEVR